MDSTTQKKSGAEMDGTQDQQDDLSFVPLDLLAELTGLSQDVLAQELKLKALDSADGEEGEKTGLSLSELRLHLFEYLNEIMQENDTENYVTKTQ